MTIPSPTYPLRRLVKNYPALAAALFCVGSALAANETVTIDALGGAEVTPFFADSSGTAQNGYTVRIGVFVGSNQTTVQSLSYNQAWVANQVSVFGEDLTFTALGQAGTFDPAPNLTNSNDLFKGQQAWMVYSNDATISGSSSFGVMSSTDPDWIIPSAGPWSTTITTAEINVVGFGSTNGTAATSSVRLAAAPATNLYWDADHPGTGGTGTWSTTSTAWSSASGGVSGVGQYAWGTTSGANYYAGANLTAYFGGTDGTVTVSGTVEARNGLNFDPTSGNIYTLASGTINLAGSSAAANAITVASGDTAIIASALTGSNGLTKEGAGIVRLDAANTGLSGNITVNAGTLRANATNAVALSGTDRTIINTGGSLLISHNDAVSGNLTLDGGTIAVSGSGVSDAVGVLTLNSNSVIDLASDAGARSLSFADSSAASWTGTLSIWNWNGTNMYGTSYGSGDRQVFFGNSASGLGSAQLNQISFYSDSGSSFIGTAFIRSTGEIAAVPEPETYAAAALLLLALAFQAYRQRLTPAPKPALSQQA